MWWMAAPAILGALSSAQQASQKQHQQQAMNLAAAEQTRYSPWTGHAGTLDTSYQPGAAAGAISGGLQGAAIGQSLQNGFTKPQTPAGWMPPGSTQSAGGAADMSSGQPNLWSRGFMQS